MCQIVGLQGCTSPRRGTRRLGGSGACWPSKIGVRPPFESSRALGWPQGRPWLGLRPARGRVGGLWRVLSFGVARWYVQEIMVNRQSHASEAQTLNNREGGVERGVYREGKILKKKKFQ